MACWRTDLFYHPDTASSRPLLATSACLLGEPVRYDGGHKHQPGIGSWLAPYLQLEAVCPEVGIGLSVPRAPLQVIATSGGNRVVGLSDSSLDVSLALRTYADQQLRKIGPFWPLCGWILKARSPSCGVGSTPVNRGRADEHLDYGGFAAPIATRANWLPLWEEEDLLEEFACQRLLLESYLCRDIVWQQSAAASQPMWEHYAELLDLRWEDSDNLQSREVLWQRVLSKLRGMSATEMRALILHYRVV